MSKMIKEMEELKDIYINENMCLSAHVVDRCIEIAKKHKKKKKGKCEWKLEDEESNLYLTECHKRQLIFDGTPKDNGYIYCPYCGKKIKVVDEDWIGYTE